MKKGASATIRGIFWGLFCWLPGKIVGFQQGK